MVALEGERLRALRHSRVVAGRAAQAARGRREEPPRPREMVLEREGRRPVVLLPGSRSDRVPRAGARIGLDVRRLGRRLSAWAGRLGALVLSWKSLGTHSCPRPPELLEERLSGAAHPG